MLIRLCISETGGAYYVNSDRVLYFGKRLEATETHLVGGEVRRVRETPAEILNQLAGTSK